MTEKDLIKKLKQLQSLQAKEGWKNDFRYTLKQEVSSRNQAEEKLGNPGSVFNSWKERLVNKVSEVYQFLNLSKLKLAPRPVVAVGAIFLFLLASVFTVNAAEDAKPGTSLYFVRIIGEKVQLATTFDEEEKARMGVKFASSHARDISEVLNSKKFQENPDQKEIQKLAQDFEENIKSVRINLKSIDRGSQEEEEKREEDPSRKEEPDKPKDSPDQTSPDEEGEGDQGVILSQEEESEVDQPEEEREDPSEKKDEEISDDRDEDSSEEVDEEFSIVDSLRDSDGIQVHEQAREEEVSVSDSEQEGIKATETEGVDHAVSQELESAERMMEEKKSGDRLDELLHKAEYLFEQEEYERAKETLEEFMREVEARDNAEENSGEKKEEESDQKGEVKGVSEKSTSTVDKSEVEDDSKTSTSTHADEEKND